MAFGEIKESHSKKPVTGSWSLRVTRVHNVRGISWKSGVRVVIASQFTRIKKSKSVARGLDYIWTKSGIKSRPALGAKKQEKLFQ